MEPLFQKIAIIGVGLIGGSMGMSLVGQNLAAEVVGIDSSTETIATAIKTKAIHRGTNDLTGVRDADLIILATPVGSSAATLKKALPYIKPRAIITDVGSTKNEIVSLAENIVGLDKFFIGGHPMAGSEQAGILGADRYLFENAIYIITPTANTNTAALNIVKSLIAAMGAKVIELQPAEHDLMVAAVSHLPHLIAAALVNTAGKINKENDKLMLLAAGGFRDTTRIAASHPIMWRDICLTNKDMILKALYEFRVELDQFENEILSCDGQKLESQFQRARDIRKTIPEKVKSYLPLLHEIVVTVPDKPGMIAEVASILGSKGINITDIEILHVREGEGGTIRLGFSTDINQDEAINVLLENGIIAKIRNS